MRFFTTCLVLFSTAFFTGQAAAQSAYDAGDDAFGRRDYAAAATFYQQSCTDGVKMGCVQLGTLYELGIGVTQDYVRAASFFGQVCTSSEAAGCESLGSLYHLGRGVPKDYGKAARLYQQACTGNDASGCLFLGDLYRDGEGVVKNTARALQLYRRSLTLESGPVNAKTVQDRINGLSIAPARRMTKRRH